MDMEAVNEVIREFEAKYKGWAIHITNRVIDRTPNAENYFGGVYIVVRDPSGEDMVALRFVPNDDDVEFQNQIYEKVQEAIKRFHEKLDRETWLHFFLDFTVASMSEDGEGQLSIMFLDSWKPGEQEPMDAYVIEPRLKTKTVAHCYLPLTLSLSGVKKLEATLAEVIRSEINDHAKYLYIANRGVPIHKLRVSFDTKELSSRLN